MNYFKILLLLLLNHVQCIVMEHKNNLRLFSDKLMDILHTLPTLDNVLLGILY